MRATLAALVAEDRMSDVLLMLDRNGITTLKAANLLAGGKNNRVIRLVPVSGHTVILKVYFRSSSDLRDRLHHEFAFSTYAWSRGLRALPKPLDAAGSAQCALYQYIGGRKPSRPPTALMVEEAWSFVHDINRERNNEAANALPSGSEACFSLGQHLTVVDARLERLANATLATEGRQWIDDQLSPLWQSVRAATNAAAHAAGIDPGAVLDRSECIISPSDFGFHNAIERAAGKGLCFHDFEYAGWDDPAKLFGDFFNQIEVPVPLDHLQTSAQSLLTLSKEPVKLAWRLRWLLPVYAVKWCCIALNPLLASDASRREFSGQETGEAVRQGLERATRQLERARQIVQIGDRFKNG